MTIDNGRPNTIKEMRNKIHHSIRNFDELEKQEIEFIVEKMNKPEILEIIQLYNECTKVLVSYFLLNER